MSLVSLAIMAKAPSLGTPKTRLQPPLTAGQARQLASAFLQDTVVSAEQCGASVFVACTPAEGAAEMVALTGLSERQIFPQRGEGLSARCLNAFQDLFDGGAEAAILLGADTPHLPLTCLQEAMSALTHPGAARHLVLGPSDDGGYYLIGLRKEAAGKLPVLLDGMIWSTAAVLSETVARAGTAGLEVIRLRACYDIDTPSDLNRLQAEMRQPAAAGQAPRTRAALQSMDNTHDATAL